MDVIQSRTDSESDDNFKKQTLSVPSMYGRIYNILEESTTSWCEGNAVANKHSAVIFSNRIKGDKKTFINFNLIMDRS